MGKKQLFFGLGGGAIKQTTLNGNSGNEMFDQLGYRSKQTTGLRLFIEFGLIGLTAFIGLAVAACQKFTKRMIFEPKCNTPTNRILLLTLGIFFLDMIFYSQVSLSTFLCQFCYSQQSS